MRSLICITVLLLSISSFCFAGTSPYDISTDTTAKTMDISIAGKILLGDTTSNHIITFSSSSINFGNINITGVNGFGVVPLATNALSLGGNTSTYMLTPENMHTGHFSSSVVVSSMNPNAVFPAAIQSGTYSNITLPAVNVAAGNLGAGVVCSSNAVASIGIPQINASGSPSADTYLKGDGSWGAPAGSGDVVLSATQTFTGGNIFIGTHTINGISVGRNWGGWAITAGASTLPFIFGNLDRTTPYIQFNSFEGTPIADVLQINSGNDTLGKTIFTNNGNMICVIDNVGIMIRADSGSTPDPSFPLEVANPNIAMQRDPPDYYSTDAYFHNSIIVGATIQIMDNGGGFRCGNNYFGGIRVGIGITNPTALLHISSGTSATSLYVSAINGNVGIGTTNPTASALVVVGTITAQGFVQTCKIPEGKDYLAMLRNIKAKKTQKGDSCDLDHDSLPVGIYREWKDGKTIIKGQDIGLSINTAIKAIQQLEIDRNNDKKTIIALERSRNSLAKLNKELTQKYLQVIERIQLLEATINKEKR